MFHHLAIDIYVKHVPVLLHMTAAVLWAHCSWKIIFSKGLAFYGGLRWVGSCWAGAGAAGGGVG